MFGGVIAGADMCPAKKEGKTDDRRTEKTSSAKLKFESC